jgi:cobalt-zinc-cadmium efflux system membrane fusion protein
LNSRDAAAAIEDAIEARHDLALDEKTLTMTQDLFDHQAASRIALQQAQTDLNKARSRIARADKALAAIGIQTDRDLDRLDALVPVNAPIAGVVLERKVSERQYVQPDPNPLLTIADLSSVWVEADAFERDLRLLKVGESADVQTTAYPDMRFNAHVAHVGDVLDPATRTVKVRFQVANSSLRLKPEMFATVTLLVDDTEKAMTVPATAVLTEGERSFVYVALDERTFVRRFVEVASDSRDVRRILSGLKPGDRVATAGAVLLRGQEDRGAS